tara:strand:- start:143 stop:820 length:678 start_codon:yes stop_codon:yes gene_type:complete
MTYLRLIWAIARKDMMIELRTYERLAAMSAFAVLVGILFNYAIDTSLVRPREIASGLIWMTIIFGGMLGMGRTFQLEEKDGTIEGILQSPIPLDAIYLGKVIANFVLLTVITGIIFIVFGGFFNLQFADNIIALVGIVSFGILAFVAINTLFSAMASRSTMGESLLPVLVFPLVVPIVIYGSTATSRLFAGRPFDEVTGNIRMLAAIAILFLVAGAWLFSFVIEE